MYGLRFKNLGCRYPVLQLATVLVELQSFTEDGSSVAIVLSHALHFRVERLRCGGVLRAASLKEGAAKKGAERCPNMLAAKSQAVDSHGISVACSRLRGVTNVEQRVRTNLRVHNNREGPCDQY